MIEATEATLAVDSRCTLGESPIWCERRGALFWTDIEAARLWMHVPASGATRHWRLPDRLGSLALCSSNRLLLGLAKGLYLADVDADTDGALPLQCLAEVERGRADTRINDGRADRHGGFVFGTKSEREDQAPIGAFYRFSARHGLRRLALPPAAIPNSICFGLDGLTLYFCDSVRPRILCCDYAPETASVSRPRLFAELDDADASPDGSIVDAEGYLWNAQWGAARIVRYHPDGRVDRVIALPVKHPTCCTIGGAGYDTLYVSSARQDLTVGELARMPASGGIHRIPLQGVLGLPESRVEVGR